MIEQVIKKDLPKIYSLGKDYSNNFNNLYNLEEYLKKDYYILKCFKDNGLIKGFIIATILNSTIDVLLVYVDKKFRKQRIGFELMNSVMSLLDVKNIYLEVSVQNYPAINLYNKLGFQVINIRKKYYKNIDAYVMKKEI